MAQAIQAVMEWPLHEVQTGKALEMDITTSSCCCICGKPIKEGAKSFQVQLLTNGNIVSTDEEMEESQGFFPVGSDCAKKLIVKFAF